MYKSFKAIRYCLYVPFLHSMISRDKNGKILKAAPFQAWLKSGVQARVEPNRKWFGMFTYKMLPCTDYCR